MLDVVFAGVDDFGDEVGQIVEQNEDNVPVLVLHDRALDYALEFWDLACCDDVLAIV